MTEAEPTTQPRAGERPAAEYRDLPLSQASEGRDRYVMAGFSVPMILIALGWAAYAGPFYLALA